MCLARRVRRPRAWRGDASSVGVVADSLTPFPSDGYTARWRTWDHEHLETLTLRWENEGWTATGEVGREAITYVLRLSATWHVRQFLLFRDLDQPDLWLGTDGAGNWGEMNGARRPDLAGCTDIELSVTPFTRSIPIRRLALPIGADALVTAATVDVETLSVVPVEHGYERLSRRRFRRTALDTAAISEVDVDEYGLAYDTPHAFRRL
jgi:hypothetical protein